MSDTPLWRLSATDLQTRYRERSTTPLDVVRAIHARIDAVNAQLNAVVSRRDAAVLAEAEAATRRFENGTPLSALDGIPLTLKESLYLSDLPTTCGTEGLRGHCPGHDEWAAARARVAMSRIVWVTPSTAAVRAAAWRS